MKKTKISTKALYKSYDCVISAPYSSLHTLLSYKDALYYNEGTYGNNYDVYEIIPYHCAIVTGYRTPNGVTIKLTNDFCKAYEMDAREIDYSDLPYEVRIKKINDLLLDLIENAMKGGVL